MNKQIKVALIGNPNTGKTSIFNSLTGLKQKTANYPGVTVEKKEGICKLDRGVKAHIYDLPGTYSLNASSMDENKFLSFLKKKMKSKLIKHSKKIGKKIAKIAVLGGSGSFAIENAINSGADAFVTSDLKYHDYFKAENKILLVDIGHYESEQYTKNLIFNFLTKKIPNFAIVLSKTNTNPIMYS